MNPVTLFLIIVSLPLLLGGCGEKATLDSVNYDELEECIKDIVESKVKIFYFEYPLLPSAEKLKNVVSWLGNKHPQFIFYDEHPDTIEEVGGEVVNSGVTAIIVQNRKDLLEKRAELHKTGYYDKWTPEMKERIFDR